MKRRLLLVPVLGLVIAGWGMAATLPPESAVELDLRWLSPPTVTPSSGVAQAEMPEGYTRLRTDFTAGGATFSFPIRYAILARHYPIVVFRYRARDLIAGANSTLLQLNLVNPAGQQTPAIILDMSEIVTDGVVREIRKDLSRFAADNAIDTIRFTFNAPAGGGELDVFELRFEQGISSPAPLALPRENVQFIVTDQAGRAVPDAELRVGLIERSNWSTLATSNNAGAVTLPVIRPVRPTGEAVDPVEAMVVKPGFVPHYIAPIEFPIAGPVEVKLTPVTQQAQTPEAPQAVAVGEAPEQVVYVPQQTTVIYESSPSVVYVERYAPAWWVPSYYVGYHPYRHYDYRRHHDDWDDHGRRDNDRDHRDGRDGRDGPPPVFRREPDREPRGGQVIPTPEPTRREEVRQRIEREVDRGNEPAAGWQDSEINRRSQAAERPAPAPPARQPEIRREPVPTPRVTAPREAPRVERIESPRPEPRRIESPRVEAPARVESPRIEAPRVEAPRRTEIPDSRSQVERGNEPAPAGGGGAGDRGSRYSR